MAGPIVIPWYWLDWHWWAYVLDDSRADKEYGPFNEWSWHENPLTGECMRNHLARFGNYLDRCICRAKGHPEGVMWYSWGLEPDMHCKRCGEDIG